MGEYRYLAPAGLVAPRRWVARGLLQQLKYRLLHLVGLLDRCMSRNPIDLFVEALRTAATQAFSAKTSAAWNVTLDEKPRSFPAGTQLLTMLLVAEPSKTEAAIQISLESTLTLAAALGGTPAPPTQFQPEHAQAVRALLAEACEKAGQALNGTQVKLQLLDSGQTILIDGNGWSLPKGRISIAFRCGLGISHN